MEGNLGMRRLVTRYFKGSSVYHPAACTRSIFRDTLVSWLPPPPVKVERSEAVFIYPNAPPVEVASQLIGDWRKGRCRSDGSGIFVRRCRYPNPQRGTQPTSSRCHCSNACGSAADRATLKEQFANSPDLNKTLLEAIMDTLDAHSTMSTQALESEEVRERLKGILLGPAQLCEALRQ